MDKKTKFIINAFLSLVLAWLISIFSFSNFILIFSVSTMLVIFNIGTIQPIQDRMQKVIILAFIVGCMIYVFLPLVVS